MRTEITYTKITEIIPRICIYYQNGEEEHIYEFISKYCKNINYIHICIWLIHMHNYPDPNTSVKQEKFKVSFRKFVLIKPTH